MVLTWCSRALTAGTRYCCSSLASAAGCLPAWQARADVARLAEELALAHRQLGSLHDRAAQVRLVVLHTNSRTVHVACQHMRACVRASVLLGACLLVHAPQAESQLEATRSEAAQLQGQLLQQAQELAAHKVAGENRAAQVCDVM